MATYIKEIRFGTPVGNIREATGAVDGTGRTTGQTLVVDSDTQLFQPFDLVGKNGIGITIDQSADTVEFSLDSTFDAVFDDFNITGNLTIDSGGTVVGHLIPSADSTYDLGSPTNKWRAIYVSGSTIYIGDSSSISALPGGGLALPDGSTIGGGDILDSDAVVGIVDSDYVRARVRTNQDLYTNSNVQFADMILSGSLTVEGSTTIVNSSTVSVNDKNLVLADSAADLAELNGAGITLGGAFIASPPEIQYQTTGNKINVNRSFDVTGEVTADSATVTNLAATNIAATDISTTTLSRAATVDSGSYGSATLIPIITVNTSGFVDSIGTTSFASVSSTSYDSATGVFTINTTDGNSFPTRFHDSDDRIAEIRGAVSATGDLSYNSSTGTFSFNVETVYTKANFDSDLALALSTDAVTTTDLTEGDNLYYTTARADSDAKNSVSVTDAGGDGSLTYSSSTGVFTYTGPSASEVRSHFSAGGDLSYDSSTGRFEFDVEAVYTKANFDSDLGDASTSDLPEGTNLYYTTARADSDAKNAVSVTDAGGDGSLSYNPGTGVFTYTGPSAAETRAHFTGSTGVTITNGSVAIGQPVATTSDVTFAKITGDSAALDGINFVPSKVRHAAGVGTLYFDSDEQRGLSVAVRTRETSDPGVFMSLGQEAMTYVHNVSGAQINKGQAVYVSGTAHALHPQVSLSKSDAASTAKISGIANMDIPNNAHGWITRFGIVNGLNTGGLTEGGSVYLSKDSAGEWSTTEVTVDSGYPFHIGQVLTSDSTNGSILVDPFTENYEYLRIEDRLKVTGKIEGDSAELSRVDFNTDYVKHIPFREGALWYNNTHKTLSFWGDDSAVVHELGIEEHHRVYNNTGSLIEKGKPLYYSGNYNPGGGALGVPTVGLANATDVNAYNAQGLAAGNIANGSYGYIILSGELEGFNTSGLSAGDNFFVGLTPGAVQNASPVYPNYPMCLGWVVTSDSSDGAVIVNQQNHSVNSFRVRTFAHIGNDLIVDGNLLVNGTQTITSTENVSIGGSIQYLNSGNNIGEANTVFVGSGLDDAFFAGHYSGDSSSKSFYVKIDATGTPDTFEWGHDSAVGAIATGIAITGAEQILDSDYGISIDFGATTGHTLNDKWAGTAAAVDVDTGFFTNRNTGDAGNGYTHLGFFFDVSTNKWRLLDAYDPEPENPINLADSSVSYGDLIVNQVEGNLLGNVTGNASTATTLATGRDFSLTGDITASAVSFNGSGNVVLTTAYNPGSIVNADINASAAIADTKLGTISTAGKVQNSATTATASNTGSSIVTRDASGNFAAGTITADINRDAHTTVIAGTYGSASLVPVLTIDANGFIDSAGTVSVAGVSSTSWDSATNTFTINTADGGSYDTVITIPAGSDSATVSGIVTSTVDSAYVAARTTSANDGTLTLGVSGTGLSGSATFTANQAGPSTFTVTSNATNANTAGTIVARDGSGNFAAGTITAALSGNASTASAWATGRQLSLTGDVTGTSASFTGSGNISIATTIAANSVALGTDTTGSYVQQGATSGNGISGSVNSEGGTFTVTSNATNANTGSTIVFRDGSGNFSAGTITAALSGNASTASAWQTARQLSLTGDVTGTSASFNGSGNISIATTIAANSVALGTDTTGNYVASLVAGTGISVGAAAEGGTPTVTNTGVTSVNSVTGAVTASHLLTAIKTVDGAGSGLDADTLDGVSSGSFLRSDAADTKTSGDLRFNDNVKATFGTGADLQIYHNGTSSFIDDAGTGDLILRSSSIQLQKYTGETMAGFVADGAATLFYDNASKLATTATGVTITGTVTATAFSGDGSGLTGVSASGLTSSAFASPSTLTIKNSGGSTLKTIIGTST